MRFGSHALRGMGFLVMVVAIVGAAAPASPGGNSGNEHLWLLGGLGLSLAAAGVVAVVAARGRG